MRQAISVLIAVGFVAMAAFVALYLRSPWWKSPVGRNLMALPVVLGALLGLWLAGRLVHLWVWVWPGGLAALDAVMWWRVVILWRLQRRGGP